MRDRAKATLLDLTSNSLPVGRVQEQIDVEIVLNNDEDEVAHDVSFSFFLFETLGF
jgi:hypothetical protein